MRKNIILLLIILYSCHPFYCNWKKGLKTVERISRKDVSGKYVSEYQNNRMILYLYKDGKFKMNNLNEEVARDFSIKKDMISGTWLFSVLDKEFKIELEGYIVMSLMIDKKGTLSLPLGIGDPDQCEGYVFKRVSD